MVTIAASNKTKMILGLKSESLSKVYISDFGKQNEIKNLSILIKIGWTKIR